MPSALAHLAGFPIRRMPLAPLLERIWQLRDNLTAYDAAYVALAERLDGPLVTCDGKLAAATGPRCTVNLITSPTTGPCPRSCELQVRPVPMS